MISTTIDQATIGLTRLLELERDGTGRDFLTTSPSRSLSCCMDLELRGAVLPADANGEDRHVLENAGVGHAADHVYDNEWLVSPKGCIFDHTQANYQDVCDK